LQNTIKVTDFCNIDTQTFVFLIITFICGGIVAVNDPVKNQSPKVKTF